MKILVLFIISSCATAQTCPQGFDVVNGKCRSPRVQRENSLPEANAYDYVLEKRGELERKERAKKSLKNRKNKSKNVRPANIRSL